MVVAGDSGNYINCTDTAGNNFTGASAPFDGSFKGKICIAYTEFDTQTKRIACGDVNGKFELVAAGGGPTPPPTPTPTPSPTPGPTPNGCMNSSCKICGETITTPGTYTIGSNLGPYSGGNCITFTPQSNGSTLDCRGFTISGTSRAGSYGIYLNGVSGISVVNCRLNGFPGAGIEVYQSNNNYIANNVLNANGWAGIYLNSANFNRVTSNTFNGGNNHAILMDASRNNTISSNHESGDYTGARLEGGSSYNNVTNNVFMSYGSSDAGIRDGSGNNNYTGNTAYGGKDFKCLGAGVNGIDGGNNTCNAAKSSTCPWLTCH